MANWILKWISNILTIYILAKYIYIKVYFGLAWSLDLWHSASQRAFQIGPASFLHHFDVTDIVSTSMRFGMLSGCTSFLREYGRFTANFINLETNLIDLEAKP